MWLQYCKINCNLGTLSICRFPRHLPKPVCEIIFVPINPLLPAIYLHFNEVSGKLSSEEGWARDSKIIESSDLFELERIITEALNWTENWLSFNDHTLYDSFLEEI